MGKIKGVKVHDIETYPNLFLYCDIDRVTNQIEVFSIWRHENDLEKLLDYLRIGHKLVGYNSLNFDGQVLQFILENGGSWLREGLEGEKIARIIAIQAQQIISEANRGGFPPIPEWKLSNEQLDLFRIWHFDNKARGTRLKDLQVAMNWDNVQDTPIDFRQEITTHEEVDLIRDYCINDIKSTYEFYKRSSEQISLRRELTSIFGVNLMNANDPKLGSEIFAKLISNETGERMWEIKQKRTFRKSIKFNEILLDYVKFDHPKLKSLLGNIRQTEITNTKGELKHKIKIGTFNFEFALGGIHGCVRPGRYKSTDNQLIIDIDVSSFYPNLAINNNFYPEHLGEIFPRIYKKVYEERQKIPKKDPKNAAYKLMLNGVYGKSNDANSYFYDPKYTMQITINGQLLILMLAEKLLAMGCELLQANTDGVTVRCNKEQEQEVMDICNTWMTTTKLKLEYAYYKEMVIRDVNNYIGIYSNKDKPKYKGAFEIQDPTDPKFKDWHKDVSFQIVPIAISDYFVKGIAIEETIDNCKDIFKFCGRAKFGSDSKGVTEKLIRGIKIEEQQQKTTRYYISSNGASFMKHYEDGRVGCINKGFLVTIYNKHEEKSFEQYNINKDFYVEECYKIIEKIEGTRASKSQLSLF